MQPTPQRARASFEFQCALESARDLLAQYLQPLCAIMRRARCGLVAVDTRSAARDEETDESGGGRERPGGRREVGCAAVNEAHKDSLALDAGVQSGQIQRGQYLLLEGVGGGFAWGAVALKY